MPALAAALRRGDSIELPILDSADADVVIARQWQHLLPAGKNVLPLAFRTVGNQIDAVLNLLLDTITRAQLGSSSFGREGAIIQLGLDRVLFQSLQEQMFRPIVEMLVDGLEAEQVMEALRAILPALGVRRPNRLAANKHEKRLEELDLLGERLRRGDLVPGMTVHQAKGREWPRVGVVLTKADLERLTGGLEPLTDEHCILYVALTRAMERCGRIGDLEPEMLALIDTV